jgi:F-type H+-transporting ATPase subunit gamma
MASAREMRVRIRSVKNIAQVTRALETVSASKVRKAIAALNSTRPYSEKAWKLLLHLARQPGHNSLHPLLNERSKKENTLVLFISGDQGLAGVYNMNITREVLKFELDHTLPIRYITVGKKGRDMLLRRRKNIIAEFSNLAVPPTYAEISALGRMVIEEYLSGKVDQVFLAYTDFKTMASQTPVIKKIVPLTVETEESQRDRYNYAHKTNAVFTYEPDEAGFLEEVITRLVSVQVYRAVLDSIASEFSARMLAMHNATQNANDLVALLQLDYNKARQSNITKELLDIAAGAEALRGARQAILEVE